MSIHRKDGAVRQSTSYQIDCNLRKRLDKAGRNLKGGISRVVEDCIRAYLPVIELSQQKEQEQETNGNGLRECAENRQLKESLVPPGAELLYTHRQSRTNLCQNAEKQDLSSYPQGECLRCALSYAFDRLLSEQSLNKGVSDV